MIIAFSGRAGSGKDTAAAALESQFYVKTAFAEALKESCMFKFGLSWNDVFTQEGKQRYVPEWEMTVREILQQEGTEATQSYWGKSFWVKRWQMTAQELLKLNLRHIVVTDCRFDLEAQAVLDMGGFVINIEREQEANLLSVTESRHSSEGGVSPHLISHTIYNNGTKEELIQQVLDFVEQQKHRKEDSK